MASPPRRHFLPWNRPLLPQAVAWLAAGWPGAGPLDLSDRLVVVPTKQAGRRLREALAEFAAQRGQAVFPPRVVTPEGLVGEPAEPGVATALETVLAWTDVARDVEFAEFREVFPVDPPERNFAWALRLAQQLARLQFALAEGGWTLGAVAAGAGAESPEAERWQQLGELERRLGECLAARGLADPVACRLAWAREPQVPAGITRIIMLATPDPVPLAVTALEAWAGRLPVDVVVFAPAEEAESFDLWGRPVAAGWTQREAVLPTGSEHVHVCGDPAAQAERLTALVRSYAAPDGRIALGVADPEVLPLVERELVRFGQAVFNPEARRRGAGTLGQLLAALSRLARDPAWENVAGLARCPDVLAWLRRRHGETFRAADFLAELDRLRSDRLPADLDAALALGLTRLPALADLGELRERLGRGNFPENATGVLAEIFSGRHFDLATAEGGERAEAAGAWREIARTCAAARGRFPRLTNGEWWELALQLYGEEIVPADKPAGALELHGWLELLFEDAPHLAVAGCNDGFVPEAAAGDPFLPEALRGRLGLKTNAGRFLRDAYLWQAIAACRPRLDVLLGRTSRAGEPLRPSRLLLQCADEELPRRVAWLFREPPAERPGQPWTRAWPLRPGRVQPPSAVAVTSLRSWLDCPFRFYLRHVRKMSAVDPAKTELDARDFGTLLHGALEALAGAAELRACTEATVLREFLEAALDRRARMRFGAERTLPLVIQLEAARQRLAKAAEIEAGERAAGWRTVAVERPFAVEIGGLTVKGKIDRIDRHEVSGAVRVLDYKTSDTPVTPADAHLRNLRDAETPPAWALVDNGERPQVWMDLQLPLYERVLAAEFGGPITCGYFNLPKAVSEATVAVWTEFMPELRDSAGRCAEGVCAAIRTGEFWPPRELSGRDAERDEFAALFHHGTAASVVWEGEP